MGGKPKEISPLDLVGLHFHNGMLILIAPLRPSCKVILSTTSYDLGQKPFWNVLSIFKAGISSKTKRHMVR